MRNVTEAAMFDALDAAYEQITSVTGGLPGDGWMRPSRCAGWAVADVLYHELLDARRALRTFATPAAGEPDRDYVSYWREFSPAGHVPPGGADAAEHARHVRIMASAYPPQMLAWEWDETAAAARRAARACGHERVATQGHVLEVADFTATLVVEASVHYLDMTVCLPAAPAPAAGPLRLVSQVLEGLAGAPLPAAWDHVTCALKGTGREPLTGPDRAALGPVAQRFPLFG